MGAGELNHAGVVQHEFFEVDERALAPWHRERPVMLADVAVCEALQADNRLVAKATGQTVHRKNIAQLSTAVLKTSPSSVQTLHFARGQAQRNRDHGVSDVEEEVDYRMLQAR